VESWAGLYQEVEEPFGGKLYLALGKPFLPGQAKLPQPRANDSQFGDEPEGPFGAGSGFRDDEDQNHLQDVEPRQPQRATQLVSPQIPMNHS